MRKLLSLVALLGAATLAAGKDDLALQARAVLEKHCHSCHGQGGSAKGGFGFVLDRDRLVTQLRVVPGKPRDSEIWNRVENDEMPPAKRPRLDAAERTTLRTWIEKGAPWPAAERRSAVSEQNLREMVARDRAALPERVRPLLRYVTFAHLANAGAAAEELLTARQGLGKLLNSLSWHPRLAAPHDVEGRGVLYRIDLRDYQWTARHWERLVNAYPYRKGPTAEATVLRGDWLIATASRAPLYYDLLEMPTTDRGLERLLRVDASRNIREDNVVRAGFNDSGVSKNNRVLERHHASYGAYWRSYDFSNNLERQNVFEYPLGPSGGAASFKAVGGEAIFHLPNGLHGYLLVDGEGRRIDKGPVEIVSDPKRPDRAVEAGVSCMSCHAGGFLPKEDQVRAHADKNARAFRAEDLDTIRALYPPSAGFRKLLDEDNALYLEALKKTGASPSPDHEPVSSITLRYESTLDLPRAAAEFGLEPAEFLARLKKAPGLQRLIGSLADPRGTVQRQVVEENFARLVRELGLEQATPPAEVVRTPFQGHRGGVTALAWSPDGGKVATGGQDETARLWRADGQALRTLQGHRGEVTAVAWSPDGKLLATAADRVVRLWNTADGELLARLEGHTDRVRALAFAPNDRTLASAGDDRVIRLWDVRGRKEKAAMAGHEGAVLALAFAPGGKQLLSGGADRTLRQWHVGKAKVDSVWRGHERPIHALAFSPDGSRAVSASADGALIVWNVADGVKTLTLTGHRNAVVAVAWHKGLILSAASQHDVDDPAVRVWDGRTGALRSKHAIQGKVWCVGFDPRGSAALLGGPETGLKTWQRESERSP